MNPYEPPQATDSKPESPLARKYANRLLELRGRGLSIGLFLRWMAPRYLILALYFVIVIPIFYRTGFKTVGDMMIGVLIGMLSNNLGSLRPQQRLWKYNEQLLDWSKVERMAAGDSLESS